MDLTQAKEIFLAESYELLEQGEEALLRLEKNPLELEDIHTLFRVFHTIKGSAGMFGLNSIVEITHNVESYLDKIRKGEAYLDQENINGLFKTIDELRLKLGEAFSQKPQDSALGGRLPSSDKKYYKIKIEPKETLLQDGFDPYPSMAYLKKLGEIKNVKVFFDKLPSWQNLDTEKIYLDFEILFLTNLTKEEILDVFDFIRGEATIEVSELKEINEKEINEKIEEKPITSENISKEQNVEKRYLRIEAQKIDQLVNLVGELVITSQAIREHTAHLKDANLQEDVSILGRLVELLRDNVLQVRMVPIGETFRRFERTVRDLAHNLGKKIRLVIDGKDTELDKNLVEHIIDPLMHLIRNAADHGIEEPHDRVMLGKDEIGTIFLNAYHETGSVVIEVKDDGRGIDKEKILKKAIGLKLAEEGKSYTEKEIFDFIFEPGFSTKENVSEISGRGVGLDVVKSHVLELRGSIEIETTPGQGTTFRIRLPLTLAIIDGFLTQVNSNYYVLPLDMVQECIELKEELLAGGGNLLNLRGEVLPFINLREFFREKATLDFKRKSIVVVSYGKKKFGLVVDKLLGELQVVIKPLGRLLEILPGVSGFTILGGGEIGFVLDVSKLLEHLAKTNLTYAQSTKR